MERSAKDVELVESSGGAFEVYRDGKLLFSKKHLGRFPTDAEINSFATR
jgi:selT/selW/selH-like putative selenoprotein